jgi:hypothetical protein
MPQVWRPGIDRLGEDEELDYHSTRLYILT